MCTQSMCKQEKRMPKATSGDECIPYQNEGTGKILITWQKRIQADMSNCRKFRHRVFPLMDP